MDSTNANKGPDKAVIAAIAALALFVLAIGLASCNVTRTITTTAQTVQRGDTTVTIMTKTVETYDGAVDATKLLNHTK